MEQPSDKKLFTEFKPVSAHEWEDKILQDLKGADYEKKLVWHTQEGFNVKPYYRAEDLKHLKYLQTVPGEFPFVRGGKTNQNNWEIRQDINVKTIESANRYILHMIKSGVTSPGLKIDCKIIGSKKKFTELLKDVSLDCIKLNLLAGKDSPRIFEHLAEFAKDSPLHSGELKGSFDFDPIGHLTVNGNFYTNETEDFKIFKAFLLKASETLPVYNLITVNGLNFSNAGASLVQELAFALSIGNEYLLRLTDAGLKIDDIAGRMQFSFGIGSNYFMEIAKLRAARLLWGKIVEAYKPENKDVAKMFIHAVTTGWNKTIYDPYVNMLRSTSESMSAALGGADSLEVLPFDSAYTRASEFSFRIARNTQIVLKEEAYFDKVIDPAAGSYYIENLTNSIAEHAWKLFIEIDDMGGYISAFKTGAVQTLILKTSNKKLLNISARKEILLGTNQYPHFNEQMIGKIDMDLLNQKEDTVNQVVAEPLKQIRGSQEFEILRLQTEKLSKRPKAFMLTIGDHTMRKARAAFSCNFFACAGYEVIDNNGFKTVDEGLKAASAAKADIIVLCSSDDEYAVFAPEANKLINDKAILVVAGEPACKPELEAKGIINFISLRSNIIETLRHFHKLLRIE